VDSGCCAATAATPTVVFRDLTTSVVMEQIAAEYLQRQHTQVTTSATVNLPLPCLGRVSVETHSESNVLETALEARQLAAQPSTQRAIA
jgi:hypothetical protein